MSLRLSDGFEIVAVSTHDEENRARAVSLGYPDVSDYFSVDAMNRDHDAVHQALAQMLGLPDSPTLRMVADGEYPEWASLGDYEERIVFLFQAMLNGRDVLEQLRAVME